MPFLNLRNDVKINYEYVKNVEKSIPVVFVNGSIFNFKQWYPAFLPAFKTLTNNSRNYFFYDYEGIGLSSIKKDKFSITQLVDELKQILDLMNFDKVHLFGASKGTFVSQAFAGTYPDRVASLAGYGVVNMLGPPEDLANTKKDFVDRLEALKPFDLKFGERMDRKTFKEIMKQVYAPVMFFKPYDKLSFKQKILFRVISGKIWPMLDQSPIGSMSLLFTYYINDLEHEQPYFQQCVPNLQKISHILWLNGTNDKTTPFPLVEKLVKQFPNSSLVAFEGYGHIDPALTKKKAYNIMDSYVSFLNKI